MSSIQNDKLQLSITDTLNFKRIENKNNEFFSILFYHKAANFELLNFFFCTLIFIFKSIGICNHFDNISSRHNARNNKKKKIQNQVFYNL